jgi:hypothetical protein
MFWTITTFGFSIDIVEPSSSRTDDQNIEFLDLASAIHLIEMFTVHWSNYSAIQEAIASTGGSGINLSEGSLADRLAGLVVSGRLKLRRSKPPWDSAFRTSFGMPLGVWMPFNPNIVPRQAPAAAEAPANEATSSMIHLRLSYKDPEGVAHPFPKDFALKVVFTYGGIKDVKILDDKGSIECEIEKGRTSFTLDFQSTKARYLLHTIPSGGGNPTIEVKENPSDDDLLQYTLDGKQFFALPKKWTVAECTWEVARVSVPTDGNIVLPAAGVGTKDAPASLTLVPKCQYIRFEFFDRKFAHSDHGDKRVNIPPVVLKGARKSSDAGAPINPCAGTHDAISNWAIDKNDNAKMCQCLLWVVTKKYTGEDLPKLDNAMLLEFGWEDGFVFSESANRRTVQKLAAGDAKRKPNKDRPAYYDLPKEWKSKNYYTRFTDTSKNKFFDELANTDIEVSYSKATPLIFCLDDIVLTTNAGSQAIKDKDSSDADQALSENSRIVILKTDPGDKYKVTVYKPRGKAAYWSESEFKKETATTTRRNVIVDYPINPRVVLFCNGFHDVYDKRTKNPNFANKEVAGARAAVLNDTDITCHAPIVATSSFGDYTAEDCGNFVFYALQYAGVDTTDADATKHRVVFALVTYWNCRLTTNAYTVAADVDNAREKGMENSMARWNAKDYEFHFTNRADIVGKTFSLFEAKRDDLGGKHLCMATVVRDANDGGSWMGKDTAQFRKSAYQDEPGRLRVEDADYDGNTYKCLATAHELGHASGLHDEYVYFLDDYPKIIRYVQYYDGMPYVPDDWSLMKNNEALRLRHYWGKAAWVNANVANIPGMTAADKDTIEVVYPAKNLHYIRPAGETLKDVYTPKHTEKSVAWTAGGSANFHLYRLGDDEFMHKLNGSPYKGLLVIATKICVRFKQNGLAAWVTGTAYKETDLVIQSGKTYYCLANHNSGASFATDAAKWKEVADKGNWAVSTAYAVADMVKEGGSYWYCKTAHTSASINTDIANWPWTCTDKGAWATGANYHDNDIVANGGSKYVCVGAHTATTFAADSAKWIKVNDKGAWKPATPYLKLDLVTSTAGLRLCKDEHTSAGRKTDKANWTQSAKDQSWTDAQKQQWVARLNKDLNAILGGKFRLANAGNEFSKSYLAVFPQYEVVDVGVAATAGTNYELEITRDGSASFNGVGTTIRVGENCINNKIIRHLYGKCDGGAAALTKTDLAEVATWVGGKAGGTFTVETT